MSQYNVLQFLKFIRQHDSTISKIRVGAAGDGGYVINEDLNGVDGVISLGIGKEVSFDLFFAEKGMRVFQYDPTIEAPPLNNSNFIFRKLGWGEANSLDTRSLKGIVEENELGKCNDMVLKFDVEGAEWMAFNSIGNGDLDRFRIITAEFHHLCHLEKVPALLHCVMRVFSLINQTHIVTHVHPNNGCQIGLVHGVPLPDLLEISFLRRDRGEFWPSKEPIPSKLDYPNLPELPEIIWTPYRD